jgi:hypothetical protein
MRSFDSRLRKLESELMSDEVVPVIDPEKEARRQAFVEAMAKLAETMSPEHWQFVIDNMNAFAAGETIHRGDLTITFLTRAARYVKGDARPLTLPPEVASLYLVKRPLQETLNHECLSCGYDVKDILAVPRFALCPICGGEYEPVEAGEGVRFTRFYKGWSKANPDKVADVYIPITGGMPW